MPPELGEDFNRTNGMNNNRRHGDENASGRRSINIGDTETTVSQDIGNFFRVLMAFIMGLWNRDFSDFDILSAVYFPPSDDPEKSAEQRAVDRMRQARNDPNDPLRSMSTSDVVRNLTRGLPPNAGFDEIIQVFLPLEGGFNSREPRGAVANFGINSEANPDIDVRNLTQAQVIQLYRDRYWNAVDWSAGGKTSSGQLSANVKLLIFDSAAQYGPAFANRLLRESYDRTGGDVEAMTAEIFRMRREKYAQLIRDNPDEYAKYRNSWNDRLRKLESITSARWDMNVASNVLIVTPPVDILKYRVSDDHGLREFHPVHRTEKFHAGTDYATPVGTPLTARSEARVASMKTHNGYGRTIVLDHGNGVYEMCAHLSRYPAGLKVGDVVQAGQVYAYTGNTGVGTGAHLHHEWWIHRNGVTYTIDEQKAFNRNLKDPAIQEELIAEAIREADKARRAGITPNATIANATFTEYARILTARNLEPVDMGGDPIGNRPLVSSLNGGGGGPGRPS